MWEGNDSGRKTGDQHEGRSIGGAADVGGGI